MLRPLVLGHADRQVDYSDALPQVSGARGAVGDSMTRVFGGPPPAFLGRAVALTTRLGRQRFLWMIVGQCFLGRVRRPLRCPPAIYKGEGHPVKGRDETHTNISKKSRT